MSGPTNYIYYDDEFRRDVRKLPSGLQTKLASLIEFLSQDHFDPRLHTKPLGSPLEGLYSFRITRDYRVGFFFSASHTIRLLAADHRSRIYKRLLRYRG